MRPNYVPIACVRVLSVSKFWINITWLCNASNYPNPRNLGIMLTALVITVVAYFFSLLIFHWHKLFFLCFHIHYHYITHVLMCVENYNLCSSRCCSSQNKRHIRGPTCNSAYIYSPISSIAQKV